MTDDKPNDLPTAEQLNKWHEPVALDPKDRAAPGEFKVIRPENRKRILGQRSTARGLDFDPFST